MGFLRPFSVVLPLRTLLPSPGAEKTRDPPDIYSRISGVTRKIMKVSFRISEVM